MMDRQTLKNLLQEEEQSDALETLASLEKRLVRPALLFEKGDGDSWFGRVDKCAPGEDWPRFQKAPLQPLLQLDLRQCPRRPEALQDVAWLILFARTTGLSWTRDHGDGWCLRTYGPEQELVALEQPEMIREVSEFALTVRSVEDCPVAPLLEPALTDDEDLEDDFEELMDAFYDCSDDDAGLSDFFPNQEGLKLGGWASWLHMVTAWSDEPSEPEFVLQLPNLKEGGWEIEDTSYCYFARGSKDPGTWVADLQADGPKNFLNMYHKSLVGCSARQSFSVAALADMVKADLRVPLGCCERMFEYELSVDEYGEVMSYGQTSLGEPTSPEFSWAEDVSPIGPKACDRCGAYFEVSFERLDGDKLRLVVTATEDPADQFRGLLAEAERCLGESIEKAGEILERLASDEGRQMQPTKEDNLQLLRLRVDCYLKLTNFEKALILSKAKILGQAERHQIRARVVESCGRAQPSAEFGAGLKAAPALEQLYQAFLASGPELGLRSGGSDNQLAWRGNLEHQGQHFQGSLFGQVEGDTLLHTEFDLLPQGVNFLVSQAEFEDDPKDKGDFYVQIVDKCQAAGLLDKAKKYAQEGLEKAPGHSTLEERLASL